jgi:hypothetical protein
MQLVTVGGLTSLVVTWDIFPHLESEVKGLTMKNLVPPAPPQRLARKALGGWPTLPLVLAVALPLVLAGCGSGGTEPDAVDNGRQQALAVSQPGDLVRYMQERLRGRQTQREASVGADFTNPPPSAATTAAARSGTLVQEEGVDEADLLQSHGSHLYTLRPQGSTLHLQVHLRADDGSVAAVRTMALAQPSSGDVSTDGMHLNADGSALTLISQNWGLWASNLPCPEATCVPPLGSAWSMGSVGVQRVDTQVPGAAVAGTRLDIEGLLVDSRRIGNSLVLVTTHMPRPEAELLPLNATAAQREAAIAALKASDVLPSYRLNGGNPRPLLGETDCYVQTANKSMSLDVTVITVIDLGSAELARTSRCFAGGTQALYMSQDNVYLATTRYGDFPFWRVALIFPEDMQTDVHKFALGGGTVQYRGSASIKGHLGWDAQKASYRLSEHNGDLRVLTYTAAFGWASLDDAATVAPSPALLTVLREDSATQSLQTVATLPNANRPAQLGKPGEQVYGVRFVGDRGYVVTFRRTDPLYVLDLATPSDPRITGELEMAGYSDYLFPLAGGLLLGVGHDADADGRLTGLKVALLDVADAAQPKALDSLTLGHAGSVSALDFSRHGLNMLVKDGVARVALPVNLAPAVDPFAGVWQSGLQRFEVDTATRSLRKLDLAGAAASDFAHATALERSLQIGDHLYYLQGSGALTAHAW